MRCKRIEGTHFMAGTAIRTPLADFSWIFTKVFTSKNSTTDNYCIRKKMNGWQFHNQFWICMQYTIKHRRQICDTKVSGSNSRPSIWVSFVAEKGIRVDVWASKYQWVVTAFQSFKRTLMLNGMQLIYQHRSSQTERSSPAPFSRMNWELAEECLSTSRTSVTLSPSFWDRARLSDRPASVVPTSMLTTSFILVARPISPDTI